jgi:hypothetical protein
MAFFAIESLCKLLFILLGYNHWVNNLNGSVVYWASFLKSWFSLKEGGGRILVDNLKDYPINEKRKCYGNGLFKWEITFNAFIL